LLKSRMLSIARAPQTIRVSELTVAPLVTLALQVPRAPPVKNLSHKKAANSGSGFKCPFFHPAKSSYSSCVLTIIIILLVFLL